MKNLVILLFINTSYVLCMEKTSEDTYTIITLDNIVDKIPQKHLLLSKVIGDMLKDVSHKNIPLPLPINFGLLPRLKICLENSYILHNKESDIVHEIAKNELEKQLYIQSNLHTIMTFAHQMEISHLLEECMQIWANKEYVPSTEFPLSSDLNIHIAKYMKGSKELLNKTAEWVVQDFRQNKNQLLEKNIPIINGSGLWSTTISSDSNSIAAGSNSGIIVTYNLKTDKYRFINSEHPGCTTLQFNNNDNQIWSSGDDGKIKIWDLANTYKLSRIFQSPLCEAFVFRYIPHYNVLIADNENGKLCIWDLAGNTNPKIIDAHTDYIATLESTIDGSLFASASYDGSVHIWDTETKKSKTTFRYNNTNVMSANFNYEKNRLICGADNGSIMLYDLTVAKKLLDREKHIDSILSVLFADTCDTLFCSGSKDCTIKLWDTRIYKPIITLYDHYDCIQSMSIDFQQQRLVSASSDRRAKIWDLRKLVNPIKTIRNEISNCTIEHILELQKNTENKMNNPLFNNFSQSTKKFFIENAFHTK